MAVATDPLARGTTDGHGDLNMPHLNDMDNALAISYCLLRLM